MSMTGDLINNYNEIRRRLQNPPNSVKDIGIDLKRKLIPPEKLSTDIIPEELPVLVNLPAYAHVTIHTIPQIQSIERAVCLVYKVRLHDLRGASRLAVYVLPRHVLFYLAKTHTRLSYPQIGRIYGGRDHTTVLHGYQKIRELVLVNDELFNKVKAIEVMIFGYDRNQTTIPGVGQRNVWNGKEKEVEEKKGQRPLSYCGTDELDHRSGMATQFAEATQV